MQNIWERGHVPGATDSLLDMYDNFLFFLLIFIFKQKKNHNKGKIY
jgi:hypothetical protein